MRYRCGFCTLEIQADESGWEDRVTGELRHEECYDPTEETGVPMLYLEEIGEGD